MKIVYRMSVLLLLSTIVFACTRDAQVNATENDANSQLVINSKAKSETFNAFEAFKRVQAEAESKGAPDLPLAEGDFNHLYSIAGRPGSEFKTDHANAALEELRIVQEIGIDAYINERMPWSETTKANLIKITAYGAFESIAEIEGFEELPAMEQDMLKEVNQVAKDFGAGMKGKSFTAKKVGCEADGQGVDCIFAYAATGAQIGYYICGGWCAGAGAIIGGIFGWITEGK